MADILRMKDVQAEYGYSRSTLLRYEEQGLLTPQVTPGGQRRYLRNDIENLSRRKDSEQPTEQILRSEMMFHEFGNTGVNRWGQSMFTEQLRELKGRNGRVLMREMRINDPVIAAIFFAIENSLKQATWRIAPASEKKPDVDAANFVDSCLHDMSFTWNDTLSFILNCLEQGFSALEVVYKRRLGEDPPMYTDDPALSQYNDGRIGWRKWNPRPAETLTQGKEFVVDDNGGIQGINQDRPDRSNIFIPINKLLLFRTTVAPANNPFGLPIHRSMYIPWWFTSNIQEIEGIGLERDLAGIPVVYLGDDATKAGANSDYQMALNLVTNLRKDEQAGVVIPRPKLGTAGEGKGILLELLASPGRRQYDAQPLNAKILTPGGWIRMGDIQIGNEVICPMGFHSVVTGVFPKGKRPVYKITMSDGRSTLADYRHLWTVTNPKLKREGCKIGLPHDLFDKYRVLRTDQIMSRLHNSSARLSVPPIIPPEFANTKKHILDPYILGVILGDGHIPSELGGGSVQFYCSDYEIAENVESLLPNEDILVHHDYGNSGTAIQYSIIKLNGKKGWRKGNKKGTIIKQILSQLNLSGKNSKEKYIPPEYIWSSSVKDRLSLLQGLLDTDGSIDKNGCITFVTSSKVLSLNMIDLIRSLGGNAGQMTVPIKRYTSPQHPEGKEINSIHYRVTNIRLPDTMIPFRVQRKIDRCKFNRKTMHNGIKSIEYVGEMDVQCILVSSPSHMYITDDFIPTHNTSAIIERYDKRKALSVLAQFIMLGMDRVGSYALSRHQGDLFIVSATAWLQSIAEVINKHAIPKIISYNVFPEITGFPKLVPGTVGVPDLAGVGLFVNQLVNADIIAPDEELERHLRQLAGLPQHKDPEPQLDENGNIVPQIKQDLPLEKAALLVRRVGLAVRSLQDIGAMDLDRATALMQPLVEELEQGMMNELSGGSIRRQKLGAPTQTEIMEEDGTIDTRRAAEKESQVDDEEDDE